MTFKTWAKENEPILTVLASALAIGAVLWAIVKFVFAPPTLAISVQTSELHLPWYMYRRLERAIAADSARLSDSGARAMREVRGFLRDTKNFTQVTLTNSSSSSLANVDLRFRFVNDVDGWAIEGDAFDSEERQRLLDAVHFDAGSGLLTLNGIPRLPPRSTLKLFIWGDVSYGALLGNDQVTVTYDGGAGRIITERTVRGVDAFVYDNAGLLVVVLLLTNLGIWNALLQRRTGALTGRAAASSESPPGPK